MSCQGMIVISFKLNMKITLFTSNNIRHNYLISLLSNFCEELFVVQETKSFYSKINSNYSKNFKNYFSKVEQAQYKIFKKIPQSKNINILSIGNGELNTLSLNQLNQFLNSDIYIVFGSSYIKGELVEFLIKKKALNIHAGISPYYRGSACNFWALYDGNPHLVGSTIHYLSKGLDDGPILYHALSHKKNDPFEYTMSTIKSAFYSIAERLKDKSILNINSINQDKNKEIRYSKKKEFNEEIIINFFKKKIDLNIKKFDHSLYKDPFFLKE